MTPRHLFNIERQPWNDGFALRIASKGERGELYGAMPVIMTERQPGAVINPALHLSCDEAQALMDELWAAGLRPTEGSGSAGSLAATQQHLADMRKIAFHGLGVQL